MKKAIIVLAMLLVIPNICSADLFKIDTWFGDFSTTANFATVNAIDLGDDLQLTITLNTGVLGAKADLQWFYYNLDSGFTNVIATGSNVGSSFFSYDNYKADGDGYYDGYVDFGDGANPTIQSTTIVLSADQALDIGDLNFLSVDSQAKKQFYMAIHAQTTSWNGETSVWAGAKDPGQPVPEPGTMLLLGVGVACVVAYQSRKNRTLT